MNKIILIIGSIYGGLSVVLGAFGAHALKKVLDSDKLASFEVGVRYQMIHAVVLLFIGMYFSFETKLENIMGWSFIVGVSLFSFSIYLLSISSLINVKLSFLGPITPLGGLFLIIAWALLCVNVIVK